ncbi:MAG: rhodanese-like domain-containing protein, partial [Saprospiraceae bacterium]
GIVIDVRSNYEWNSGHRNEALHYDWDSGDLQSESIKFDKTRTYYLYCASGLRSKKAMEFMKSIGFNNVINLGGYSNLK